MPSRNNVTFRHPAAFVPVADAEGIMSTDGAGWFVVMLRKVPRLVLDPSLCQENEGSVDDVTWYFEAEMHLSDARGTPSPDA